MNVPTPIGTTSALSPAGTPLTPYHLTPEQVRFFDDNGYLLLKQWITGSLLRKLQEAGNIWIQDGLKSDAQDPNNLDYSFAIRNGGRVMFRVDYVHNKGQQCSLEMLGSPQVLAVAESLCGRNFVPTYESMVFKQTGDGEAVQWHQDAVHPRNYRIFNYDLYLDASRSGAGALRVLPKTQAHKQEICDFKDKGWEPEGMIEVEMEPGDVLLHDVMVVHGSPRVQGNPLRRTIYYEFRAAEEILKEGPWDKSWIDKRLRLVPLGLKAHQRAYPDKDQFSWGVSQEFRPQNVGSEAEELKVAHLVHSPGSFCSAGDIKIPIK